MPRIPFNFKNKIEAAKELAEVKNQQILNQVKSFKEKEQYENQKKAPPVARNDLGIGRK